MNEEPISYPIAYLNDLTVQQDGQFVKKDKTLDENLRALDAAAAAGTDISKKADKVENATENNFAGLDANGNLKDSGKKADDFATAAQGTKADNAIPKATGATSGNLAQFNENGEVEDSGKKTTDFATAAQGSKADTAVQPGDLGNVSAADADNSTVEIASGNLRVKDAGITMAKLASDVKTAIGNALTETDLDGITIEKDATNGVQVKDKSISKSKLDTSVQASLGKADTALQEHQDISGKADKASGHTTGNLAKLDANGNAVDSGKSPRSFVDKGTQATQYLAGGLGVGDSSNGTVLGTSGINIATTTEVAGGDSTVNHVIYGNGAIINGNATAVLPSQSGTLALTSDIPFVTGKADKVQNATVGNLAALDASGNLVDSGTNPNDFATAAQGTKADTALQPNDLDGTTIQQNASTNKVEVKDGSITNAKLASEVTNAIFKKAAKVQNATNGDLAGLDSTGNLTDSGKKPSDFAAANHNHDGTYSPVGHNHAASEVSGLSTVATSGNYTDLLGYKFADGTTIQDNANEFSVKDGAITTAKLASDVTSVLNNAVKTTDLDGTTIEKDATNGIQVKDGAITTNKLANLSSFNLVDTATGSIYTVQITNGRLTISTTTT